MLIQRVEVVPSTMELGGPGELLCMDFEDYGRSNLLIIKDRFSGLLRVYLTKDKTAESAIKGDGATHIWIAVTNQK